MLRLLIIIASGLLWPSAAFIRSVSTTSAVHVARPLSAAVQGDLVFTPSYVSTDNSYFNVSAVSFKEDGRYSAQLTYSASYPDVLVPLIGTSINGLCYSKPLLNVQQFPCGMLGFFKKSSSQMWLATTNLQGLSTRVVPLIRPLPFECSDEIPCAIRTAAPMAGEVGGCDLGSYDANVLAGVPSDTLVVVTWNNTRYLFRPLQYFAGVGDIRAVPTGWPAPLLAGLAYDPGLQFWFFLNSDGASGECIMSLINANGTAMIYNSDEDDPSTPTGLQLVASVGPNSTQPASASICQPSVQFLYLSGWGSAVLSLTCRSGEGWLWVYQPDGIPYPISLAGSFSLDPPLHMAEGPLIVDIAFMTADALIDDYNETKFGILTTVSLLGSGLMREVPRLPGSPDEARILSLAVFMSNLAYTVSDIWLTETILAASRPEGVFEIGGEAQYLRNGLGWSIPTMAPLSAHNVTDNSDIDSVMVELLRWMGSAALYGAVASDYLVLIDPSDGVLAKPSAVSSLGQRIVGGLSFVGPTLIGHQQAAATFTRVPSSASAGTAAVLQAFEGDGVEPRLLLLASLGTNSYLEPSISFSTHLVEWSWAEGQHLYTPSPISVQYSLPLPSSPCMVALQWVHDTPLLYSTDEADDGGGGIFTIIVGTSASDMILTMGGSYPAANGTAAGSMAPISAQAPPYLFVCHGTIVTCYKDTIGYEQWTYNFLESGACTSGNCSCMSTSTLFPATVESYLVVSFQDYGLGTQGLVVLNYVSGILRANYSSGSGQSGSVASECGSAKTFGDIVELTPLATAAGFATPMVGSPCVLIFYMGGDGLAAAWGVFVLVGAQSVSLSSLVQLEGSMLLLSSQSSPEVSVFALSPAVMHAMMILNPSAEIYSANPTYSMNGVMSYTAANGLLIGLNYSTGAASGDTSEDHHTVEFVVRNSQSGDQLWRTNPIPIAAPPQLGYLVLFTIVQTANNVITTWACVGAGPLLCIIANSQPSGLITFPPTSECYGPPAASSDGLFLIWATEGYAPLRVSMLSLKIDWHGITNTRPAFQFPINQSSCSDPILANDGLLIRCSLVHSTVKRLYLVDATAGTLIFGYGPVVGPRDYEVSIDGLSLIYLDESTNTATSLRLASFSNTTGASLNVTVCHQMNGSFYVFSIDDDQIVSTRTPILASDNIIQGRYSMQDGLDINFVFLTTTDDSFSMGSIMSIGVGDQMIDSLSESLCPSILDDLVKNNGFIFVTTKMPTYVTNAYGQAVYMSASGCNDCHLDCPTACTLNLSSGLQTQYTSGMLSIQALYKPNGSASFGPDGAVTSIIYSGDVQVSLDRLVASLEPDEQPIGCYTSATAYAASGRYCILSGATWSVLELVHGSQAYFSLYYSKTSGWHGDSQSRSQYHGYTVWSEWPVMAVEGELGLGNILTQNRQVLPPTGPAGQNIASVSEVQWLSGTLNVSTNAGQLIYTSAACDNTTSVLSGLPMCHSTLQPECVCFMVFNSSLPSGLLVNAVLHADMSPTMQAATAGDWAVQVLRSPFVLASLIMLCPPLVTHVVPGLVLYCWVLVPPIALAVLLERVLRLSVRPPGRLLVAARAFSRVAMLLTVSIAFSVAFNVSDGYLWKQVKGEEPFPTGSYIKQGYLRALEQDYNSRSLGCVWEHLSATVSNFLQMGFILV